MRPVDKDYLFKHQRKVKFFGIGPDDESWGYAVPTEIIENAPTITPQNEPLTCDGCIHEEKEHQNCNYCVRAPYLGDYYYRRLPERQPEVIPCVECEHLMFSDFYGECRLGRLTGPVRPEDFCGLGERRSEPHEL